MELTIDGSFGEGGGQILRTSLSASLLTGIPFRIEHIRAGRRRPGLLPQHLAAVEAAGAVGDADVDGATIGATGLSFRPGTARPGRYRFSVGTAGSACLVVQTVLPALLTAGGASEVIVEGGTYNPGAPPFDFLDKTLLPLLGRCGPQVRAVLRRAGFHPAGGGRIDVHVDPAPRLDALRLPARGDVLASRARALVCGLPRSIGERELAVVHSELGWNDVAVEEAEADGVGNVVLLEVRCEHVTEVFTGFGRRGLPAEAVATGVVDEARRWLRSGVPVGPHLADQLLVPMVQSGWGSFRTAGLTRHFRTNAWVLGQFFDAEILTAGAEGEGTLVEVRPG